jgi:hypothetical protein
VLFPWEALVGWLAVAILAGALAYCFRRWTLVWCGIGVAAAGLIYYSAVMAHRPQHYYALLEFLASTAAIGAGFVIALIGVTRWLASRSQPPPAQASPERDSIAAGDS